MVACSDYFRAMLTGPGKMKESREDSVELKGVSAQGLKAVVDFAYTGKIKLSLQNLEEVFMTIHSDSLCVSNYQTKIVTRILLQNVTENCHNRLIQQIIAK